MRTDTEEDDPIKEDFWQRSAGQAVLTTPTNQLSNDKWLTEALRNSRPVVRMEQNGGWDMHPNALSDLTGDLGVEGLRHLSYLGFSCISSPLLGPPVSPSTGPY